MICNEKGMILKISQGERYMVRIEEKGQVNKQIVHSLIQWHDLKSHQHRPGW